MRACFKCDVCGYVHRGNEPPESCPICGAPAEMFSPIEIDEGPGAVGRATGTIVVVGGGIAGLTAVETARETAPDAAITLVSRERGVPYYRLNLTRFLAGLVAEPKLEIHPPSWFAERRIELVEDELATIDRTRREIRTRSGRTIPYGGLVLATGADPFVPPIAGTTLEGVGTFRTRADARRLISAAEPGRRAVVIGGGLLGLETAGALVRRGLRVAILEGNGRLLPRQLARPAAELLVEAVRSLGVDVRTGVEVEAIEGERRSERVRLRGGETVGADLVVISAGIRPAVAIPREAGLEVGRGVVVDDAMRTSDPAILAAGDVAEHRGTLYGLWPPAFTQGAVAGSRAAGGSQTFRPIPPSSRLKVLDVELFSCGDFDPSGEGFDVVEERVDGTYHRFVLRGRELVGANLYGDAELAGTIQQLIEGGPNGRTEALAARYPDLVRRLAVAAPL